MTSFLNVSSACGAKGSFGVGTGDTSIYSNNFLNPVIVPKDSNGNVKPGYSLQSSATSVTGLDWSFTGANGKTIQTYQYPNNCPIPFPSPVDISSDLVLITREDSITTSAGITDLYMPTLGVQGVVPRHTLPPICDVQNQVVFYFDDANAAVNVFQKTTNTWRMGWLRAIPTFDFVWRASDLLTSDKLNAAPAYTAPYNAVGIFFSALSVRFTNHVSQTVDLNGAAQPGFYFINYSVTNGLIDAWNTATGFTTPTPATITDDLAVSAICVVDQKGTQYRTPTVPGNVSQVVCAVATGVTSSIVLTENGWWGFLANLQPAGGFQLFNPNLSPISSTSATNYVMDGQITTISVDKDLLYTFFLGGNYTNLKFANVVVNRVLAVTGGNFTQKAAVAMQYNYSGAVAMTSNNYSFIGQNAGALVNCRDWEGRITQSNYNDDFFAYGGNFRSPPSTNIITTTAGYNPLTIASFIAVAPENVRLVTAPSARINVPTNVKGGLLTQLEILFLNDTVPFNNDGSIYGPNNYAIGIAPNDGDLRQSSFAPVIVGGNFLQPIDYPLASTQKFQTQTPIVAANWWLSSIQIYVGQEVTTGTYVRAYLYPDTITNKLQAPIQYWTYFPTMPKGENFISIYGGGTPLTGSMLPPFSNATGGFRLNTNLTVSGGNLGSFNTARTWFLELDFSDDNDVAKQIPVGVNPLNQKLWTACWNLYAYPSTGVTASSSGEGLFSSKALQLGQATQTTAPVSRRILTYTNLKQPVPLNTLTFSVYVIPLNYDSGLELYAVQNVAPPSLKTDLVVQATFSEDRQGDFSFSAMNMSRVPSVVYGVPQLISSESISPSFSLLMTNRYEVYKSAWGNSDKVALGLFTNFQEVTDLQYSLRAAGTAVDGIANTGRAAFDVAGTSLTVNTYYVGTTPPDFQQSISVGDIMVLTASASPLTKILYRVSGAVTQTGAPTYTAVIPVTLLDGTPLVPVVDVLIDFILSRSPTQTPFVLKDNLGPYLIGNGSAPTTLRDVYLASNEQSGKAFRYVPDYQSSFLSFNTYLLVGSPTVDNTVVADTVLFNTNSSAILLAKAASNFGGEQIWNVVSTYGNIGFNNQNL